MHNQAEKIWKVDEKNDEHADTLLVVSGGRLAIPSVASEVAAHR